MSGSLNFVRLLGLCLFLNILYLHGFMTPLPIILPSFSFDNASVALLSLDVSETMDLLHLFLPTIPIPPYRLVSQYNIRLMCNALVGMLIKFSFSSPPNNHTSITLALLLRNCMS